MEELRTLTAQRDIRDALNTTNSPVMNDLLALPIGSEARFLCDNLGLLGPYKFLQIENHFLVLDMINGPKKFCSTICKPYYRPNEDNEPLLTVN